MPEIGRPVDAQPNPYRGVRMGVPKGAKPPAGATPQRGREDVGETLNRMANNGVSSKGAKFVDSKSHNKMGKDEFLHLLTVQLANQDPLKPVDQKKFASELANFSSLEQLTNMNQKMEAFTNNKPVENKFFGASFLGKKVITGGATLKLKEPGDHSELAFELPKNATNVIVRVFDKNNQNVANIERDAVTKGTHTFNWDGMTLDGQKADKGEYTFKVFAWDETMASFQGKTQSKGIVTGVTFEGGDTVLEVDGSKKVFLRDVESFQLPDSQASLNKGTPEEKMKAFKSTKEM